MVVKLPVTLLSLNLTSFSVPSELPIQSLALVEMMEKLTLLATVDLSLTLMNGAMVKRLHLLVDLKLVYIRLP